MRKAILIIILGVQVLSCSKKSVKEETPPPTPGEEITKKVLIIGIDGCRPDAITAANTPNLDALIANGTYSLDARNIKTTFSGPGWSSMLTGVWEDKHGVTDNSFNGSNFSNYPHFFKYIEESNPVYRTVSVSQWHPINDKIVLAHADATSNAQDSSEDVKNKAVTELGVEDLTTLFVHFDDVDHAGHGSGFSPTNPNYLTAIETVDHAIGSVITALKGRANYSKENWLILVSTDHGGLGTSHGGNSEEERTIFVIASGDTVPKKEIAKTTTQTTVPPAENCLNSTTELEFKGNASISIPNNTSHSFGTSQDFSIECRFRSDAPNDVSIVAKKDWGSGLLPGYVFSFKPSTKKFKVNVGDSTNRVDVETEEITDNKWHTVSATFDRDGMLDVYIDGVLKNSASMAGIGNIDNTFPFTIGADGNNAYKYNGYIAEVRVFNTLLSADDVGTWTCKVLDNTHSKYANLQGHWKLTEGTGNTITDSSMNLAHGTLAEGVWKDATVSEVIDVHNYDNTPRIVDVAVTALNHLCIPVQSSWDLDGSSIINTDCSE
ncbi:alkaline phosphatase family protein [Flavivirga spongiicola]|uniref:Alkaline phosphatase family protein n=1 Tax=Flavivirga spongiicola TaxID=421621 RepID=A0ABU7XNV4_9FLAO|nr:alkaline phosphatase family protein [Flavivirga sp. MEBiC05379]MDO5977450.1 alkaline phosphatase family protein [Flavivirga sp. MEBiC05379]